MLRGWNKVGARPSARRAVLLVSVVLVSAGGLFASPSINRSARTTRGPMFSRDPRPTTPPKRIPSVIA
ncbi:MAG: hypothetical protein KC609_25845, partial [Myxococcales bacterium]|nr:hypothetical protein [Myxococcales bacterium]